jgi:hypothetical protein
VPERNHPGAVERKVESLYACQGCCNIIQCGCDAAVAPDPAVLDVAGCIAAPDKVDGESIHSLSGNARSPEAAVEEDDDRERASAFGRTDVD